MSGGSASTGLATGGAAISLRPHELHLCAELVGVEQLPVVLGRGPQSPDLQSWATDIAAARAALTAGGLVDGGGRVADELEDLLRVLGSPVHEIAARRVGRDGVQRLCVATDRLGATTCARREPGENSPVALSALGSESEILRGFLGEHAPLESAGGRCALSALQEGLAAAEGFAGCAQALEVAGLGGVQASVIAEALTTATAFTEIVTIRHHSGQASDTPAAMVVYDAPAGRVVATPRRAPDGALWVSFAPGSWDRVARGLQALDELAGPDSSAGQAVLGG